MVGYLKCNFWNGSAGDRQEQTASVQFAKLRVCKLNVQLHRREKNINVWQWQMKKGVKKKTEEKEELIFKGKDCSASKFWYNEHFKCVDVLTFFCIVKLTFVIVIQRLHESAVSNLVHFSPGQTG